MIYDGIHYDPLVLKSSPGGPVIQQLFPLDEDNIIVEALKIAEEAQKVSQRVKLYRVYCFIPTSQDNILTSPILL